jgi:uncharacterized membrane protein YqiK
MKDPIAKPGHNSGEFSLTEILAQDYEHITKRIDDLMGQAELAPKEVLDDTQNGVVSDLVKLIVAAEKSVEAARVDRKEPYLNAGRTVDGYFKALNTRLELAKKRLSDRVGVYLRKKAEEERAAALKAEAEARAEAARLLQEAQAAEAAALPNAAATALDASIEAHNVAQGFAAQAQASPADLARTRNAASLSTLKEVWKFQVLDFDTIDMAKLRPFIADADIEKAIGAYIRVGNRQLAGVRIYKTEEAVIR